MPIAATVQRDVTTRIQPTANYNMNDLKESKLIALLALGLAASTGSQAITISSGPAFMQAAPAPLAGTLQLTTDAASRVSVSVSDGVGTWKRDFYDYGTSHSVPLFGFKPGRTNNITVTVWDRFRNAFTAATPVVFVTDPLPADFPVFNVLACKPQKMEPGYTLFRVADFETGATYLVLMDNSGQVVWYSSGAQVANALDVRLLDNGNLFIPLYSSFTEVNLLGQTVQTWPVPAGLGIDPHDGLPSDHDSILYLSDQSQVVPGFPTSATDPGAPTQTTLLEYQRVIEMSSTNGAVLNNWSLLDMLDPLRITYLTFTMSNNFGVDCEHANAVSQDPRDDSLIVSMRNQNAVVKCSRATGQLKWILGPPENWGPQFQPYLLTPVGTPFEWNYGQHAPTLTPQGTLLLYDDGNFRACPFDAPLPDSANYSRAVEYRIDEQAMQVSQVWEYGGNVPDPLYTGALGSADWLTNTGNVLVNFGFVSYVNHLPPSTNAPAALMVRIQEVTHEANPEVVFDLSIFDPNDLSSHYRGYGVYRSHRVPDLYGHPAAPVADLSITNNQGVPHLEFSADPMRTYVIQASTDLKNWAAIGTAGPGEGGTYDFDNPGAKHPTSVYLPRLDAVGRNAAGDGCGRARSAQAGFQPYIGLNRSRLRSTRPVIQDSFQIRRHLKGLPDLGRDRPGAAGKGINKYPIGFALGQHRAIGNADELVAAQRTDLAQVGNPGLHPEHVCGKRRAQILDAMRAHDPGCAARLRHPRAAGRLGVPHGRLLHPLYVGDVVDVAVRVHGAIRHFEFDLINCVHNFPTRDRSAERQKSRRLPAKPPFFV